MITLVNGYISHMRLPFYLFEFLASERACGLYISQGGHDIQLVILWEWKYGHINRI